MERRIFGDDTPKWVVLCGCDSDRHDGAPAIVAWIDDDRRGSGRIHVDSNHSYSEARHKDFRASTYSIRHRACRRSIRLNETDVAELLDAIDRGKENSGRSWAPIPHHLDASVIERRQVILLDDLCLINGALRRRKTRPRK